MRNLLPERNRKKVKREYYTRLAAVALFLFAVAFLVGAASLLPTYFALEAKRTAIQEQVKFIEESLALRDASVSLADVRRTNAHLAFLQSGNTEASIVQPIREVVSGKPSGVSLSGFQYVRRAEGGEMQVTGQAASRDALLTFKEALEKNDAFSEVVLPVSNLAQTSDIDFTMTIIEAH